MLWQVEVTVELENRCMAGQREGARNHRWVLLAGVGSRLLTLVRGTDSTLLAGEGRCRAVVNLVQGELGEDGSLQVFLLSLSLAGVDVHSVLHLGLPSQPQPSQPQQQLSQYARQCRHHCQDKINCLHPCCKSGVIDAPKKSTTSFIDGIQSMSSAYKNKFPLDRYDTGENIANDDALQYHDE